VQGNDHIHTLHGTIRDHAWRPADTLRVTTSSEGWKRNRTVPEILLSPVLWLHPIAWRYAVMPAGVHHTGFWKRRVPVGFLQRQRIHIARKAMMGFPGQALQPRRSAQHRLGHGKPTAPPSQLHAWMCVTLGTPVRMHVKITSPVIRSVWMAWALFSIFLSSNTLLYQFMFCSR